jgi:multiple sugar transport system permease protein
VKLFTINSEKKEGLFFNLPLIFVILIFIVVPVIGTFVTGFFRDVTFLPEKFIGLGNFKRLLSDIHFRDSLIFTILFVLVSVTLEIILGTVFALVLNEKFPGRGFLRVAILIPWTIPVAISARVWQLIYNFNYGLLNYLSINLGFSNSHINWLGTPVGAFISIVISDVWKTTPFIAIIILAGLSTIPNELYKQAMIDGTNFIKRFFYITLPLLKPVIIVALLFRTIDAIRIFDLIYVLTGGGPGGSTSSVSLYAFKYYLTGDFGYGSAISILIFLLASILAVIYIKIGNFTEEIK